MMYYPDVPALEPDELELLCHEYLEHNATLDPHLADQMGVKRGLRNLDGTGVLAGITNVSNVIGYDKKEDGTIVPIPGRLVYRGIDIDTLAAEAAAHDRFMFEEVIWLLLFGSLPTQEQYAKFRKLLEHHRELTQFYCVTLLYLQTELFKKAAMQKEMDALNLLYDRQRKQYQIARQNVQIINRKCHELKVQIADLRRLQPDEATTRSLDEAEQAARMYDANAATGNEVLDVVLTEKSLLCEAQRIRLNCVADGTCLAAIEPGDLYALFSNLLDQAIDAAAQQQNDRRMIDLLVCRRQGFAVINVIGPALSGSQPDHGRRHSYELKVARRVVQKYSGTMATEPRGELFAVKIVMPLTRG